MKENGVSFVLNFVLLTGKKHLKKKKAGVGKEVLNFGKKEIIETMELTSIG